MGLRWLKQHPQHGPEESLGNVFFFASALRGVSDRCGTPWALHALAEQGPLLFDDFPVMQTPVCERASAAFAILWQFPSRFQERERGGQLWSCVSLGQALASVWLRLWVGQQHLPCDHPGKWNFLWSVEW